MPPAPAPISVIMVTPQPHLMPDELICTVGTFALFSNMYPPDGLCDYLYYTHVVLYNKSQLAGIEVSLSWKMFQAQIKSRSKTAGGVSFDARYVSPMPFDDQGLKSTLKALASANIANYGVLNLITRVKDFDKTMDKAKGAMEKLKSIQGNDAKRRTIIALGMFDYNEPNAWVKYKEEFRKVVEESMADTVIAISSTGMVENRKNCYSAPTSVLDSSKLMEPSRTKAKSYPDLKTHSTLVAANVMYNKNTTRVGLSWEMGTLMYLMNKSSSDFSEKAYFKCNRFQLTQRDVVDCQGGLFDSDLLTGGMKYGYVFNAPDTAFSWEDEESIKEKLDGLKASSNLRGGLSWLLYDVHLGDYSGNCEDEDFKSVKFFKEHLKDRFTPP